jgi:hypothetical protein
MVVKNQESVQTLNTAIIKSKERKIDSSFEDRLANTCKNPTMSSLNLAISHLSETQKISKDQAAIMIVDTIRELDNSWDDYLMMEGIEKIKDNLKDKSNRLS